MSIFEHVSFRTCKFSNLKLPKEEIIPETELTGHKKAAHITWDAGVTVQAHLKLDVFLYAGAYKNRSFTAFDAREAYWNRRTQRYMYTPSIGRVL